MRGRARTHQDRQHQRDDVTGAPFAKLVRALECAACLQVLLHSGRHCLQQPAGAAANGVTSRGGADGGCFRADGTRIV